ncbi:MAG: hypothetical protein U0414_21920 [Polyangiaceae bacterium]
MSNNAPPIDSIAEKAAAQAATAVWIDLPRVPVSFDPTIGEQALLSCKDTLLAIDPAQLGIPYCDSIQAAIASMALADQIASPRCKPMFDALPASIMGDATVPNLRTVAQALFYVETRARTKAATSSNVRVDPELMNEGITLRDRMLRVLAYYFEGNAGMKAELADIRLGSGYADLASDLARVATHYSTHRSVISKDTAQYNAADEDRARHISKEIVSALHVMTDSGLSDLRNRAFHKNARLYAKLKAAADLLFIDSPLDLANFAPLRQVVMTATARSRGGSSSSSSAEAETPAAPTGNPVPAAPTHAPAPGTGPGGSPIL